MSVQAIGEPVRREEDLRLLRGRGHYVDDAGEARDARGHVLRSPYAHARIRTIDADEAKDAPGVLAILTGEDLRRRGLGTLMPGVRRRRRDGAAAFVCPQPLLAQERVRYVGDPVAFVVADTLDQAKDAAELIEIDYEPLPAVITSAAALAPGAPAVWEENPGNEAFFHEIGDREAVDAAFAKAAHRARRDPAQSGHGKFDGAARLHRRIRPPAGPVYDPLHHSVGARDPRRARRPHLQIAAAPIPGSLRHDGRRLWHEGRLLSGIRVVLVGVRGHWPPRALDRRAQRGAGERRAGPRQRRRDRIGARPGRPFLALRAQWQAAIGAYYSTDRPTIPLTIGLGCLVNTYGIPAVHAQVVAVLTNTMTTAPYRGGSRPEPIYVAETIIDKAARELGIEPVELRRRNTIPASAMPFTTALQQTYDSGDFVKNLTDCLALAGYDRVAERREAAQKRGKLLGVGVATAVAATGGRDYEHAEIRFDPSGGVVLMTGSMDHGQGHGTTFKQILSEKLGIDADLIRYRYGDSDLVTMGIGTFGSRSAQLAGSAIVVAADRLIDKGRKIAAHMMEAATNDVVFEKDRFSIAGTDRSVNLAEVARQSFHSNYLPNDIEAGFSDAPILALPGRRPFRAARICARSRSTPRPARSR